MSNLLQESKATFNAQKQETAKYVSKWEKTGLLEGLNGEYDKHNTAILLENQAKQLISEAGNATSTSAGQEDWNGVALPLVRRIFAEISAKEFVSVQPMNLPSGLVFWLDFKYAATRGSHTADESIFGSNGKAEVTDFTKGLYNGPGKEGYTLNFGTSAANAITASADGTLSVHDAATLPADIDFNLALASYLISAGAGNPRIDAVSVTVPVGSTAGKIDFGAAASGTLHYPVQPADNGGRGDFEANHTTGASGLEEAQLNIPELNVQLEQEALIAKTRKLKVVWTPEFAQDLNAYHSIDAEAELTSMLSEYISMEIDLEILQMIYNNASHTGTWNANPTSTANGATIPAYASGSIWAYQQDSYNKTLGYEIQKVSNKIHRATMRGGANFIVCSPDVAGILESLSGFAVDTDGNKDDFAAGVERVGSFASRYKVYKNPYWNSDDMIIGFRGSQFLETGAVYAPYIPLIMTPLVYDPVNFTPRKGVMTRYAKKVVRKDFFGKISILNKY
jgi:hypothetical protein